MKTVFNNQRGVTLIEAVVGIGLVSMVVMSLYLALFNAARLMGDAKQKVGAVALANERMEMIRNLEYEEIGTQNWIPAGPFAQTEEVSRNDFKYTLNTHIEYVDDPFDGQGLDDDVENDYKQARVEVLWQSGEHERRVIFVSKFVPDGLESDVGGGVLSVNVITPEGDPIVDARVEVDSVDDSPPIHGYSMTGTDGNVRLPGMPEQEYQITVSKEGYETVQTYPNPPTSAFTPLESNVFVTGLVAKTFRINLTADLEIFALDTNSGEGIEGVEVVVSGGKQIGSDPDTFSLSVTETTDSEGAIDFSNQSPGSYSIVNLSELSSEDYEYVGSDEAIPFSLEPGVDKEFNLLFADKSVDSLLILVRDGENNEPIANAQVEVTGENFEQTALTNSAGRVFFPITEDPPLIMTAGDYQVTITATGFQEFSEDVSLDQLTKLEAGLTVQ